MADKTKIEWTDATWNPTVGCTRVSKGCEHCYAETVASGMVSKLRGQGPSPKRELTLALYEQAVKMDDSGKPRPLWSGKVGMAPERLDIPLRWTKPRRIFVDSMSDLFHDDVTDEFIADVFAVMRMAKQHTFQLLTKRPERMGRLLNSGLFDDFVANRMLVAGAPGVDIEDALLDPAPNIHIGVSVEDQETAEERVDLLLKTPAAVRWLSMEPLIADVHLYARWINRDAGKAHGVDGVVIDWVVVGGESGKGARPMHPAWARTLRDVCVDAGVPFHFKQWGAFTANEETGSFSRVGKRESGRVLDGRTWDEQPRAVAS